ncbi:MAG TPA: hypothetical protein VFA33_09140 [Bryobacteraceae bacterium]|nr:hypothetical protein [Bryobacteraceae bacterium]
MRCGTTSLCRLLLLAQCGAGALLAQVTINGKVVDDTGVAVSGVRVEVRAGAAAAPAVAFSDLSGAFVLNLESAGEYQILAARETYFQFKGSAAFQDGVNHLTITLNHLQEVTQSVDVVYSPPAIDLQEPAEKKQLNNVEVITVPFPAPQDLRNALPLMNGVVQDTSGRVHFNGGDSSQTNFMIDGFNASDPVTGEFNTRLSIESVRTLDYDGSRFSAEKGRGSAGALDIKTQMGDDRWRVSGTNFFPGFSSEDGFHLNKWTPRLDFSGPLVKGRAWFHNGFDAFYDDNVVHGLPSGQNRTTGLTTSNLSRFQVNVTPSNILTASFLFNYMDQDRSGLSFLNPVEATTNWNQTFYMSTVKDQMYFGRGMVLEVGFADSRGGSRRVPQGNQLYQITPFGNRGNYFSSMGRHTYRQEWLSNLFLPAFHLAGSHQLKFGVDFQRSAFHQEALRHPYQVLRTDLSVARMVTFVGNPFLGRRDFEGSQYIQDRWNPRGDLLVEAGLRADWDEVVRDVVWSPRISAAWAPRRLKDTKIAAGIGIFHDPLLLSTLAQHQDQVALSTFFAPDGAVLAGAVPTAFFINERQLAVPRYRTSSLSLERKLPWDLYGKATYTHKVGSGGFMFANTLPFAPNAIPAGGLYYLRNWRHDRYDALEFTVRRTFAGQFEWVAGYTRSNARTDAVVDYSLESPLFAPQGPGPYPWDAPNRFLTWGWAPLPKRLLPHALEFLTRNTNVAYLLEYRTGFPFSVVNEQDFLVGNPNAWRYPGYFNINLHFERKFRAAHCLWAWRFGLNNLTNNGNPNAVNNDIDSPYFLAYARGQARAFAVRLRFLGKSK